jgi:hypothetical protein
MPKRAIQVRATSVDGQPHRLRLLLPDRLCRQHVRHLGRAHTERYRPERPVRRRMAVAAHHHQTRQRQSLLRPDHMHDALARIGQPEQRDAVTVRVALELGDHAGGRRIEHCALAAARRHVVVGDTEGQVGAAHLPVAGDDLVEGMVRAFVQEMPVDRQQRLPGRTDTDFVGRPDLIK